MLVRRCLVREGTNKYIKRLLVHQMQLLSRPAAHAEVDGDAEFELFDRGLLLRQVCPVWETILTSSVSSKSCI